MAWRSGKSTFESAIDTGKDRNEVDAGYYGMMLFTYMAIGSVLTMIAGLAVQSYFDPEHRFDALMLGQGVGLIASAYGIYIAAVGGFKRLDQDPQPAAGSSSRTTIVEQHDPPGEMPSVAAPLPVEIIANEPVPTRETPAHKPAGVSNAKPKTKAKPAAGKKRFRSVR